MVQKPNEIAPEVRAQATGSERRVLWRSLDELPNNNKNLETLKTRLMAKRNISLEYYAIFRLIKCIHDSPFETKTLGRAYRHVVDIGSLYLHRELAIQNS